MIPVVSERVAMALHATLSATEKERAERLTQVFYEMQEEFSKQLVSMLDESRRSLNSVHIELREARSLLETEKEKGAGI